MKSIKIKMLGLTIAFSGLAMGQAQAEPISCRSTETLDGSFAVSATLEVDSSTGSFTYVVAYRPLVPRWPPAGDFVQGSAAIVSGKLILSSESGSSFGELQNSFFDRGFYGTIDGHSFIGCKFDADITPRK